MIEGDFAVFADTKPDLNGQYNDRFVQKVKAVGIFKPTGARGVCLQHGSEIGIYAQKDVKVITPDLIKGYNPELH